MLRSLAVVGDDLGGLGASAALRLGRKELVTPEHVTRCSASICFRFGWIRAGSMERGILHVLIYQAMSKEPTRHQLSARLAYNAHTPAFLLRMQQRVSGSRGDGDEDDEFEDDGSGRPPIPRRPALPQRPDDDPGSADEDDMDEKPQVVVLKEGKHLSAKDVENEKRKGGSGDSTRAVCSFTRTS